VGRTVRGKRNCSPNDHETATALVRGAVALAMANDMSQALKAHREEARRKTQWKMGEAEKAIRSLCHKWEESKGVRFGSTDHLSFYEFESCWARNPLFALSQLLGRSWEPTTTRRCGRPRVQANLALLRPAANSFPIGPPECRGGDGAAQDEGGGEVSQLISSVDSSLMA
jgi:hypothetical protein